jgi:hypothetical protein
MHTMWILIFELVLWVAFIIDFIAGRQIPSRQNVGDALLTSASASRASARKLTFYAVLSAFIEKW